MFIILNLALATVLGELACRALDMDLRLLKPLLYYQTADLPVHEMSEDPELLYGLKPGATASFSDGYVIKERVVSVNSLGFRGPERSAKKPDGVFRIVVLGSSNAYGAKVNDRDTFPAQLERMLDAGGGPVTYEVWNGSANGYKLSQLVRRAELVVDCCEPDLLIFQVYMFGRRPFLAGNDDAARHSWEGVDTDYLAAMFRENPDLYRENLPRPPIPAGAWGPLFAHSTLLRSLRIAAMHLDFAAPDYGVGLGIRKFQRFTTAQGARVPIYVMGVTPANRADPELLGPESGEARALFVDPRPAPTSSLRYREVHPPGYVYRWYAQEIAAELARRSILP